LNRRDKYEIISELARRRGFFWPSYEIYGGVSGFITFGPLGTLLKKRIEEKFRKFFIQKLGIYEIENSVITPAKIFEASGHVESFKEPMVECTKCKRKFRADHLLQEFAGMTDTETEKLSLNELNEAMIKNGIKCPECGGKLGDPKYFLTMFETRIGPYAEAIGYGRPEAAQGIFVEFQRLYDYARGKLPFGVVQIGHALRNEISPRQGPIRLREFTIIDIEFFFDPEEPQCQLLEQVKYEPLRLIPAELKRKGIYEPIEVTVEEALKKGYIKTEWQAFFMAWAKRFLKELGVPPEKQRFIEKLEWERAHYSAQGYDQEIFLERWGWVEVSGHNYRTDYDLRRHMEYSGSDMRIFKQYERPIREEKILIKPIIAEIGPEFKTEAQKIVKLLKEAKSEEIEESFKEKGYYTLNGKYKILPRHVEIIRETVEEKGKRFIPHVVEPSFGLDRLIYVALEYAYTTKNGRTVLSFPRDIAPIQVGVYPLVSKDGLPKKAWEVYQMLIDEGFTAEYDESGSIGRRYARADEIGAPLGITIDYQTLEDDTITVRDRDSWKQVRAKIEKLPELLSKYFKYMITFEGLGEPFKE